MAIAAAFIFLTCSAGFALSLVAIGIYRLAQVRA